MASTGVWRSVGIKSAASALWRISIALAWQQKAAWQQRSGAWHNGNEKPAEKS